MSQPHVSFIIIAFNEERNIGRTVRAILAQDGLDDFEIVVVDDGSRDGTAKIVKELARSYPQIRLEKLAKNQGRGAARSIGVKLARGKLFAFVDADIVLPAYWLKTCLAEIANADAVGGTALPDGDVTYIYNLFGLEPKVARHSTTVTGSNGLYRREIFDRVGFDSSLPDGEDVAFNHVLTSGDFRLRSIPGLIVEHRESKTLRESLSWLYQSGLGATRQLKQFKKIRQPDIAYAGVLAMSLAGAALACWLSAWFLLLIPVSVAATSLLHFSTKFVWQPKRLLACLGAVIINSCMLAAYYLGRTVGFVRSQPAHLQGKQVMVCFDFEGDYGMPYKDRYDLAETTHRLLTVLDRHAVKAVFFVVGRLIEERPEIVQAIAAHGHEIGLHGYTHENLAGMYGQRLKQFASKLHRSGQQLEVLVGKRPVAFRAPYLMAPVFRNAELETVLEQEGYRWISNRELRYSDELFRPGRLPIKRLRGKNNWFTRLAFILLNTNVLIAETLGGRADMRRTLNWLRAGTPPFRRAKLVEIPIYSPLDCDLLGLPHPYELTPHSLYDYTVACLVEGVYRRGMYYNLTFHDWIIGSANRLGLLDRVLGEIASLRGVTFTTEAPLVENHHDG